jgi:hypothetical protein
VRLGVCTERIVQGSTGDDEDYGRDGEKGGMLFLRELRGVRFRVGVFSKQVVMVQKTMH